jgi:hypothetical protein
MIGITAITATSAITGLLPATIDYVRAYATNGVGPSYGSQVRFTTAISLEISTLTAASIASTSMNIFHNTVNSKSAVANYTYTGFVFDATRYFIGFGAGTGSATDNHQLHTFLVTFT